MVLEHSVAHVGSLVCSKTVCVHMLKTPTTNYCMCKHSKISYWQILGIKFQVPISAGTRLVSLHLFTKGIHKAWSSVRDGWDFLLILYRLNYMKLLALGVFNFCEDIRVSKRAFVATKFKLAVVKTNLL